ncbi:MAG: ribonuclease HII [Chloroflexi bacterium]|jgi:ribonuclease HII|nr:ribonuclease HII [Chloroflexota bacterium]
MALQPDLSFEQDLWYSGQPYLAGLDEAGRGAWAGPVAAGAVMLPADASILERLYGVRDSKLMTPRQRQYWAVQVKELCVCWGVGFATHAEIDRWGIVPATRLAMQRALEQLEPAGQHLLIDAVRLPQVDLPQTVLIKGDVRCLSIAAASVLAKTTRDAWMQTAGQEYQGYGFERHKGYGTLMHQQALARLGPCPIHRLSFAPLHGFEIH